MKEYRVKKGLIIFNYILSSFLILILGGMTIAILFPFNAITEEIQQSLPDMWRPLLFMIIIVILIIGMIAINKRRVIIRDESIVLVGFLKNIELKFTEIKGFNTATNPKITLIENITIEPKDRSKKAIVFNNTIENYSEIKSIVNAKLTDLDLKKREDIEKIIEVERKEILSNQEFGISTEDREDKLKKARLTSYVLIGAGVFVTLWTIFFPKPYEYAIISCVALPLITLIVIKFWKGLIRIDGPKESAYPKVTYPLVAPGIALSLRVIVDISIDDYTNVWLPAIAIAITYTGILMSFSKHLSFKKGKDLFSILSYAVFTFIYGFGTVVMTNCVFDKAVPQMFVTEVVNKEINKGKQTSYYLYLAPWNNKTENEKVTIDSNLYNSLNEGDEVSVYLFEGKFNIPWIMVDYKR